LNGSTWTALNYPGSSDTSVYGISGNLSVGTYTDGNGADHGFLHDGASWTPLNYPGASPTVVQGISGGNIVGYTWYGGWCGFIYNSSTGYSAPMRYPGSTYTSFYDIDGARIVGSFQYSSGASRGFILTIPEPAALSLFALGACVCRPRRRIVSVRCSGLG
jgi:hypothetical protein